MSFPHCYKYIYQTFINTNERHSSNNVIIPNTILHQIINVTNV